MTLSGLGARVYRGRDWMARRPHLMAADTAPMPALAELRLSIGEALQGALTRAVVIQMQQLDLQQQQAQTEQAKIS